MQGESSTQATKVCTKCGHPWPATPEYFHRHKGHSDGLRYECKACHRADVAAWNARHPGSKAAYEQAHREERRAYKAAYRIAHRQEISAYNVAYDQAHRSERRSRDAARRAAHPEEYRAGYAAWNAAHREEQRAHTAAWEAAHPGHAASWRAAHPDERRAHWQNRRARKLGNGGTHTAADVAAQRRRQGGRCIYCGAKIWRSYHVDHVFPLVHGGTSWPENLVITCQHCNVSKNARDPREFVGDRRPACPGVAQWPWEEHPPERLRVDRPGDQPPRCR